MHHFAGCVKEFPWRNWMWKKLFDWMPRFTWVHISNVGKWNYVQNGNFSKGGGGRGYFPECPESWKRWDAFSFLFFFTSTQIKQNMHIQKNKSWGMNCGLWIAPSNNNINDARQSKQLEMTNRFFPPMSAKIPHRHRNNKDGFKRFYRTDWSKVSECKLLRVCCDHR